MQSWTRQFDIFEKDYWVIPISDMEHWSLAIVCYPRLLFKIYKHQRAPYRQPAILFFDSLGCVNLRALTAIRSYIGHEWENKKGLDLANSMITGNSEISQEDMPCYAPNVPL